VIGVGAFTVRVRLVLCVSEPLTPVIVTVAVPAVAVVDAVSVNVADEVELVGLKLAVTPLGKPLAENPTVPVNPLTGTTVTVEVPLAPCVTLRVAGEAVSE
jgi:hypothetical protein